MRFGIDVSGAQHGLVAVAAGNRVLMALGARLRVEDGPEAGGYRLALLELGAIGIMSGLINESINKSVITRWCFDTRATCPRNSENHNRQYRCTR